MAEDLLPIDKVAKESGLAASALRYYERCGVIGPVVKIRGKRHYSRAVLHRLSVIKVCQALGFSLTEIVCLLDGGDESTWKELAVRRRSEVEKQMDAMREVLTMLDSALGCSCDRLANCPDMGPHGRLAVKAPQSRSGLVDIGRT
ncbi:MerR family transcriptional regulator [Lentzea cavernae]|uniref:MerR family transcriptional regulator n=1 Tax=Lentzea cavernae TaxID=2020703 RepID=A0ABQ3MH83_9PSEU|nr:MerR family transcriptional regulator [Lentzea cavernae]